MGAIFGFTGKPDSELLMRMASQLAHRGGPHRWLSTPRATFAYAPDPGGVSAKKGWAGLVSNQDQMLAFAGFLTEEPVGLDPTPSQPSCIHSLSRLLAAFQREGSNFLARLRGAFVLALLDGENLHLVRDGAGARTLYYTVHTGRTFFAVEPKALWSLPGFSRQIRPEALAQFFSFSFLPGSGTMLENLHELQPGHRACARVGETPVQKRYFFFEEGSPSLNSASPPASGDPAAIDAYWCDAFRRELRQAIANRAVEGEPLVTFLSGGIDSSVVTRELARMAPGKVKTLAVHFGKRYPNELEFARMVARHLGTEHVELEIRTRDFLPRLRRIVWHLDDPIGDPVAMPNFELAGLASREGAAVYNGEGGDPCFGGPKNIPIMLHHWYGGLEPRRNDLERAYLTSYRRAYEELPRLLAPEWLERIDFRTDLEGILTPFFKDPGPDLLLHRMLAANIRLKGAHLILPKVERMLAAHGVVPLSPLFDEKLIRLAFSLPPRLILSQGVEKVILKRAYAGRLPEPVLHRPKSGMRVPVHFWFQGELKRYARRILNRRALRRAGIFNPERVQQILKYDIEESRGRYGIRLWMLVTFEIWRRLVVEGEAP